jgi:hypothetical protein
MIRDIAYFLSFCTLVACVAFCSSDPKSDVKSVVDVVKVLCPDLSCADTILADPNVKPEVKAQLRAGLKR